MNAKPLNLAILVGLALALGGPARGAAEAHDHHDHAMHDMDIDKRPAISRTMMRYALPEATLIADTGKPVRLSAELDSGSPVLVNFIFTTCTAICPLTSAVFARVQDTLAASGKPFRLISISIDPEQDTPARLREFAGRYGAGANWHFLTGDAASIQAVQRGFDAWRGGKSNHAPLTYLRVAPGMPWVRYEGMVDADTLVREYHRLTARMKTVQRDPPMR